jgi:hypothetical protein
MNRKAFFMGLFSDLLGWLILFLGVFVLLMIVSMSESGIKYDISAQGGYIADKSVLINILQTPVSESTNIADEILFSIERRDSKAKEEIDGILNYIYGRADKVCWALWRIEDGKQVPVMDVSCNGEKKILFDQDAILPRSLDAEPVRIRLAVLGYKK